jgi:putative DNA primase/helicase
VAKNQPAIRWKQYQLRVPNLDEVHDWWGNGHRYGLAIICGNVSGNLEMTELEARALTSTALTDIANAADSLGCGETWDQLLAGYVQQSPTGGMHLVYRIADHEVPGNEKVAMDRSAVNDKGDLQPLVLSETRGDGGYFVGAPSPGFCHPSGEPWLLTCGTPGVVPTISWDQRCLIHEAIKRALDIPSPITSEPANLLPARLSAAAPGTVPPPQASVPLTGAASISPGDHWASETDWAEILEPAGWTLMQRMNDGERLWVRPGKNRRDGHSASTDYQGKPGLYVWSTSTGLDTEIPLTKLFIHAHYSFNGDMSAAARDLVRQGFGSRQVRLQDLTKGELVIAEPGAPRVHRPVPYSDFGNAQRLWKRVGDRFRWVHDANVFYSYVDGRWDPEHKNAVIAEWNYETAQMYDEGVAADSVKDVKWATSSANAGRTNAAVGMMKSISGVSVGVDDFDQLDHLVNLVNGELNLTSGELGPHDPTHLMSRRLNAKFDPNATAPHWDSFLAQVLPDEQTRKYVQRAVAYTLLGRADHRSFFIVYGPTGTGKSQFLSTLEHVFGDYGGSAAEGTFHPGQGSLTNDLHGLRNKRLITTSETADGTSFNENLMKRLTGRDQIVSRELYQSNVTWTPECTIWIATNHPPRFNSDDNAIWRRAKLIPFMTEFGTDSADIPDYARKYLYAEADGILNWILEGLRDFMANGLQEPSDVVQAQVTHREQSDSVVRFLDDQFEEEVLVAHKDGQVRTQELYLLYEDWCRAQGEKRLGSRRFLNRMTASGRATYSRTSTQRVWKGIYRPGSHLVPQLLDR